MKVVSPLESNTRWDDYMEIAAACERAGLPQPSEEPIGREPGTYPDKDLAGRAWAVWLDSRRAAVLLDDGRMLDMDDALVEIGGWNATR